MCFYVFTVYLRKCLTWTILNNSISAKSLSLEKSFHIAVLRNACTQSQGIKCKLDLVSDRYETHLLSNLEILLLPMSRSSGEHGW